MIEYSAYRFKLDRFNHNDQRIISITYLVNADLEIVDPERETDPKVQQRQAATKPIFYLRPAKNKPLKNFVGFAADPDKVFSCQLNHGQPIFTCAIDKDLQRLNRQLVIHKPIFECYSAYDLAHVNKYFGRYAIENYYEFPDWLAEHLSDSEGSYAGKIGKPEKADKSE